MIDHIEHLEDLIFLDPTLLRRLCLVKNKSCTVKYDGRPSVVFGIKNTKHFVGTKSVLNKISPIVCYSHDDIESHYHDKPDLAKRLKVLFNAFNVNRFINNSDRVYQGDFLFLPEDLMIENVDGTDMYTFTPNVIKYAIHPHTKETHIGGISIHSKTVSDEAPATMFSFDVPIGFWTPKIDVRINGDIPTERFFKNTLDIFDLDVRETSYQIMSMEGIPVYLKRFFSYCVRESVDRTYDNFVDFVSTIKQKEIDSVKTTTAKQRKTDTKVSLLMQISTHRQSIQSILKAHAEITLLKNEYIRHLDQISKTSDVRVWGGHEGYVFNVYPNVVKLVDRNRFTALNFEKYK